MLRKTRIAISGVVLIVFAAVFAAGGQVLPELSGKVLSLQFVPCLVKALSGAGVMAVATLAAHVLLAALYGRVYCSCFCPLGILQDLIIALSKKLGGWRKGKKASTLDTPRPRRNRPFIRHAVLVATAALCVAGSFALLNLLDPYSLSGRLVRDLLVPPLSWARRGLALLLERFDIYALSGPSGYHATTSVWIVSALCFALLVVLAATRGRVYCNVVCPAGTLLGNLARAAPYRVRVCADKCVECGRCERRCRAGCIDASSKAAIDVTRCVLCLDCIQACPTDALYVGRRHSGGQEAAVPERRRLLIGSAASFSLVTLSLPLRGVASGILESPYAAPIVPPGAVGASRFARQCTACHACVAACPQQVIQPAMAAYERVGTMQPVMDFTHGYCAYECNRCGQVCPTGAIAPLGLAEKKLTRIGKVRLIEDLCVVYTRNEDCGACAELCPTHAVYTEEEDGVLYPKTHAELCIGCGACEHICPQMPKAILVDPVALHERADPPFSDQAKPVAPAPPSAAEEDFPF